MATQNFPQQVSRTLRRGGFNSNSSGHASIRVRKGYGGAAVEIDTGVHARDERLALEICRLLTGEGLTVDYTPHAEVTIINVSPAG